MSIILELIEGSLHGRIYQNGSKTSAYLVLNQDNKHLFTEDQILLINNEEF
jgi:hypothetical protein